MDRIEIELSIEELEAKLAPSGSWAVDEMAPASIVNHNETLVADEQDLRLKDIEELETLAGSRRHLTEPQSDAHSR